MATRAEIQQYLAQYGGNYTPDVMAQIGRDAQIYSVSPQELAAASGYSVADVNAALLAGTPGVSTPAPTIDTIASTPGGMLTDTAAVPVNLPPQQSFQERLEEAVTLNSLQSQIQSGEFGRDYGHRKELAAQQQYQSLGGDAALSQYLADPQIRDYIVQHTGQGGLGGLVSSLGTFAGEAGVKEGLMLAGAASGYGYLTGNPITMAGSTLTGSAGTAGMTAAELAAADPYLQSLVAQGATIPGVTAGVDALAGQRIIDVANSYSPGGPVVPPGGPVVPPGGPVVPPGGPVVPPGGPVVPPGGGGGTTGGNWWDRLSKSFSTDPFGVLSSVIGLGSGLSNLFGGTSTAQTAADPFAPYRAAAAGELVSFYNNPYGNAGFTSTLPNTSATYGAIPQNYAAELQQLMANPSSVTNLPGYQFLQEQGMQGVQRGLATRGQTVSGRELLELQRQDQGLANQQYLQQQQLLAGLVPTQAQYASSAANAQQRAQEFNAAGLMNQYNTQLRALSTIAGAGFNPANAAQSGAQGNQNAWASIMQGLGGLGGASGGVTPGNASTTPLR